MGNITSNTKGTVSLPGDQKESQTVPTLFLGEAAVLLATGPSLTPEVVATVKKYQDKGKIRVFGCNDSYRLAPWVDVFYACDDAWWNIHAEDVLEQLQPNCHIWTQGRKSALKYHLNYINGSYRNGLSLERNHIHYGSNSGFQQINLAVHYGITRFYLVGYDMQPTGGKAHFFGDHPARLQKVSPFKKFIEYFNTIQPEYKKAIVNCTPHSALPTFKRGNLEEELNNL